MDRSVVSVVIPAFNRRNLLNRAIESVLTQSFTELSLVVVDDASTEDLGSCRHRVIAAGHRWIRLDINSGPAHARNVGAGMTESDWIMFLDSDDVWNPEKVEKQLVWHRDHPGIRISQVLEDWIRDGKAVRKPSRLTQLGGDIFEESIRRCVVGCSCVALRRDLWEETGGFDPFFRACEDYELWLRITCREPVGLAGKASLTEKHAGDHPQLSRDIPALDRFRILALAKLLRNGIRSLNAAQRELVGKGLTERAGILASGASVRGRDEWASFFAGLTRFPSDDELARLREYCGLKEEELD